MNWKKVTFVAALTIAMSVIVGCGEQKDPRISDDQAAWNKQQYLQAKYGGGSNSNTVTEVRYVTVTNTKTNTVSNTATSSN